jgi:hypothetical protein
VGPGVLVYGDAGSVNSFAQVIKLHVELLELERGNALAANML